MRILRWFVRLRLGWNGTFSWRLLRSLARARTALCPAVLSFGLRAPFFLRWFRFCVSRIYLSAAFIQCGFSCSFTCPPFICLAFSLRSCVHAGVPLSHTFSRTHIYLSATPYTACRYYTLAVWLDGWLVWLLAFAFLHTDRSRLVAFLTHSDGRLRTLTCCARLRGVCVHTRTFGSAPPVAFTPRSFRGFHFALPVAVLYNIHFLHTFLLFVALFCIAPVPAILPHFPLTLHYYLFTFPGVLHALPLPTLPSFSIPSFFYFIWWDGWAWHHFTTARILPVPSFVDWTGPDWTDIDRLVW